MAVRRERVILELQDDFTTGMARAAAATALLDRELNSLSRESVQSSKTTRQIDKDVDGLGKTAKRTDKDIDKLSGRLRILAEVAAIVGPSLAPIGAVGVAAISGIASELGFAAVGAGVAVLAFQGVGDALKALNKAELEPTAKNIEDARRAMERLSPAAREFTKHLEAMKPALKELRDMAATGLLPGLSEGLDGLESALPRVEKIITAISTELGSIGADAGKSIGSDRWAPFLDFIAKEGPSALGDFATAAGNTAHALAGLWMSTDPLNDDFSQWLVKATADLDRWANGLGQTQGFADFMAYVEETGPQVAATFGALADAALQIVEATAPLGGPVLKSLEALANVVSAIADSDLGTPIFAGLAALSLYNRTLGLTRVNVEGSFGNKAKSSVLGMATALTTVTSAQDRARLSAVQLARIEAQRSTQIRSGLATIGKTTALVGGLAVASTGAADSIGLSNTASLALMGTIGGPWGTAIGAGAGAVLDLAHANDGLEGSFRRVDLAIDQNNLSEYTAGIADLKTKLQDIKSTSGVGDFLSDTLVSPLTHPIDTLTFKSPGDDLDKQIKQREAQQAASQLTANAAGVLDVYTNAVQRADAANTALATSARETGQGFLAFGSDLDDSKVSLDAWLNGMHDQAVALEQFTQNARTAGRRGLREGLIKELEAAGPAGALRMKQLADGTRDEITRANREWARGRRAIQSYVDMKVPPKVLEVETSGAESAVNDLIRFINGKHPKPIKVATSLEQMMDPDTFKADGGTIPGARQPYGDKVLLWGAPGEEVITNRNGEADRFRADRAAGVIPGYAAGGTIGSGLGAYINRDLDMKFPHTLKAWNVALSASTTLLEKEKNKRQDLLDQADQVRSAITSGYKSDLFGQTTPSVWMSTADRMKAGKGDVFSTLTGDIGNLNALKAATGQLKAKGLDGAALADLLSNAPLSEVQAFASGSKADALRYENLYNQRASLLVGVGNTGASAAFGPQLAASKAQVAATAAFTRAIDRLDGRVDGVVKALHAVGVKRLRK